MKGGVVTRHESCRGDLDRLLLATLTEKRDGFVSGEELSTKFTVSRTAIWKRIGALKALGFGFESVPSRGYRLTAVPDLLYPAAIAAGMKTVRLGQTIIMYPTVASTNLTASRLGEEGAPEGTVVLAESQEQGKGRRGRSWLSPPGVNLYCSVLLRPSILPSHAPQLTFLSAVAVARTIGGCTQLRPVIKWPNDILVNGKKVAGLLNEMTAETDSVTSVVLGIGVNLNMQRSQFPHDLRHPASSLLLEEGSHVDRISFTRTLLGELDTLYGRYLDGHYEDIRREWLSFCGIIGERVRVSDACSPERTGIVVDIDDTGALLLKREDGSIDPVFTGDVSCCGEPDC